MSNKWFGVLKIKHIFLMKWIGSKNGHCDQEHVRNKWHDQSLCPQRFKRRPYLKEGSIAVGECEDFCAKLQKFLGSKLCHISWSRDKAALAFQSVIFFLQSEIQPTEFWIRRGNIAIHSSTYTYREIYDAQRFGGKREWHAHKLNISLCFESWATFNCQQNHPA